MRLRLGPAGDLFGARHKPKGDRANEERDTCPEAGRICG
ncbi:hypothetical protein MPNT_70002 [Candidatus Methylacidithermus pantelleriae]|uniref:Uncharacterized protein n=1 Tax=Candidatus Methylacidithermus pantelleriae TaxID=2744239 RepID=A0A8J2BSI6_9BACT|nr:hypothetical protein MPNT_70002 [Candidatus Methylacidithermus pantelleriae]